MDEPVPRHDDTRRSRVTLAALHTQQLFLQEPPARSPGTPPGSLDHCRARRDSDRHKGGASGVGGTGHRRGTRIGREGETRRTPGRRGLLHFVAPLAGWAEIVRNETMRPDVHANSNSPGFSTEDTPPLIQATERSQINTVPTPTAAETRPRPARSAWKWELLRWCGQRVRIVPRAPRMNIRGPHPPTCPSAHNRDIVTPKPSSHAVAAELVPNTIGSQSNTAPTPPVLAINQRRSSPCGITPASTTALHVSTRRSRDTRCSCCSARRRPPVAWTGEGGGGHEEKKPHSIAAAHPCHEGRSVPESRCTHRCGHAPEPVVTRFPGPGGRRSRGFIDASNECTGHASLGTGSASRRTEGRGHRRGDRLRRESRGWHKDNRRRAGAS